jgi:hypothetical protein
MEKAVMITVYLMFIQYFEGVCSSACDTKACVAQRATRATLKGAPAAHPCSDVPNFLPECSSPIGALGGPSRLTCSCNTGNRRPGRDCDATLKGAPAAHPCSDVPNFLPECSSPIGAMGGPSSLTRARSTPIAPPVARVARPRGGRARRPCRPPLLRCFQFSVQCPVTDVSNFQFSVQFSVRSP